MEKPTAPPGEAGVPGGPVSLLPDGRLRVEQGPVSLVAEARWPDGPRPRVLVAAGRRALEVLEELAGVRPLLGVDARRIRNPAVLPPVARAMWEAARRFPDRYVTPLVAVAGAVADAVADFLWERGARRVVVTNGGDVALRLAPGQRVRIGVWGRIGDPAPAVRFRVAAEEGVGGVATSGFGGRSLTLGVADAVTVVAGTAALADACATLVANAVDVDSPAVERAPAERVVPDTDLRGLRVTVRVGSLTGAEIEEALDRGAAEALRMVERGLVRGALLHLRGRWRVVGRVGTLEGGCALAAGQGR